jgi:hypothetical protein
MHENKKIFFSGWAGPDPKGNWVEICPKMKSGQNQPKRVPTCGWTQPSHVGWVHVPAQKPIAGYHAEHNNQLYIIIFH